ncbi:hypothetical protein P8C59_006695 [Phyllachora maydis]|uniref:Uncharacterized protein n=1 Tax=Phyllachora maydis TaxID=1825666 RepID=A0AAD9I6X6_9PEZI|nr:hypothetical protein P8C59_006695 [Phyllachora maydis]
MTAMRDMETKHQVTQEVLKIGLGKVHDRETALAQERESLENTKAAVELLTQGTGALKRELDKLKVSNQDYEQTVSRLTTMMEEYKGDVAKAGTRVIQLTDYNVALQGHYNKLSERLESLRSTHGECTNYAYQVGDLKLQLSNVQAETGQLRQATVAALDYLNQGDRVAQQLADSLRKPKWNQQTYENEGSEAKRRRMEELELSSE